MHASAAPVGPCVAAQRGRSRIVGLPGNLDTGDDTMNGTGTDGRDPSRAGVTRRRYLKTAAAAGTAL